MSLTNIFKPLSTFLKSAPSINLNIIKIIFWERLESNPGPLGEKQECYLCAMQPPISLYLIKKQEDLSIQLTPKHFLFPF